MAADEAGAAAALWRHGADALLVVAADGSVAAANPAWTTLFGITPARITGHAAAEWLHPADSAAFAAALALARGGVDQRFAARVRDAGGRDRACTWTMVAADGDVHVVGREDAVSTSAAAARTRRSLAMARLAGGIAHDFNNLLQSLRNTFELIRLRPGDAVGVSAWAENGLRIVDRGGRLTAQLVAASGQRRNESVAPVPVLPLLQSLATRLRQIVAADVTVVVAADAVAGNVLADARQLEGALLNLALNAGEAMPHGGTVTLRSARLAVQGDAELPSGDYTLIEVTDTGAGMSESIRERAFDPFVTTKRIGSGAGLGLAQVDGFARRHGGSVRIASSDGAGTALHLLLPALVPPPPSAAARPERVAVSAGPHTHSCSDSLRVLGWQTLPLPDLQAALAAVRAGTAGVLVVAAGPDGEAALQALRAEGSTAGVVVIGGAALPLPLETPALAAAVDRAAQRRR